MSARRYESRSTEKLEILNDTIAVQEKLRRKSIFDAEHFFDGYFNTPEYGAPCPEGGLRRRS